MSVSHAPHGSRCSSVSSHPHSHPCAFLFDLDFLPFYFDLSFTILSLFSFLMHPKQHTELDNLITMQNLRTSAKGSNDAYDVTISLTRRRWSCRRRMGVLSRKSLLESLQNSVSPFVSHLSTRSDEWVGFSAFLLIARAWPGNWFQSKIKARRCRSHGRKTVGVFEHRSNGNLVGSKDQIVGNFIFGNKMALQHCWFPTSSAQSRCRGKLRRDVQRYSSEQPW